MIGEFYLAAGVGNYHGPHQSLVRICTFAAVMRKAAFREWEAHALAESAKEKSRWDPMSTNDSNKAISDSVKEAARLIIPAAPVKDQKATFDQMVAKARARAAELGRPMTMKEFLASTF